MLPVNLMKRISRRIGFPPTAVWGILLSLQMVFPVSAQTVNRAVPAHSAPSVGFVLSTSPSTQEIRNVRLFAEPLVPNGAAPSAEDNRRLADALSQYARRSVPDDFSALEQFVADQPGSPWTPSLMFDVGLEYYKTGWYSKALDAWERAWPLLQPATDPAAKALGDRVAGELALMYGRIGRMGELSDLLDSIKGRSIMGAAEEKISGARQGLWTMQHRPEVAFRCGPLALDRINAYQDPSKAGSLLVRDSKSTTNGFSLDQVAELSRQLGMNYQMAYRTRGSALLLPAVVNWKVGHYAALIREDKGRYLLQDPTFQNNTWVSPLALEEETTGYFLVPAGDLPAGWRAVSADEGAKVWGKGQIALKDNTSTTPYDPKRPCQPPIPGMAVATVSLMLCNLNIQDNPVGYQPPVGPAVRFMATYNQYEVGQPANFSYSNMGQKWTFNWLAYLTDDPDNIYADVTYYTDQGGTLSFIYYNPSTASYEPEIKSQTILTRTTPNSYVLNFPDGSQYIFAQPTATNGTSRNVFMTQMVDPQGNAVQISYDDQFRVIALTDAIGQVTVFSYTDASDPLKITRVTDPFGRFATFQYDANGLLTQITDCIGLTSQFIYDTRTFIQAMTTPYGTSSFAYVDSTNEWGPYNSLETTLPDGEKERVEFNQSPNVGTPSILPTSLVPVGLATIDDYLNDRNTYFWDRNAYAAYLADTNDYSSARLYHWLHSDDYTTATGVEESEQEPLENRVWFNYEGQPGSIVIGTSSKPTLVGRVLDDGTTQLHTYTYNAMGQVINSVDPLGRGMTFVYSTNSVDLLEVSQTTGTNDLLQARYVYNAQHLRTALFDAAGQMTTNTYNPRGQLLTTTDPLGETYTCSYDADGYLRAIVGPLGAASDTMNFGYDVVGRITAFTNTDGYTLKYSYDNLDRLTNITYPDGTFDVFTFSNLDLVVAQDRLRRRTVNTYDSLRQLVATQDPLGRVTRFEYCGCGAVSALIDAMGRQTRWDHDVQGRVTARHYADGSQTTYNYENTTSRLQSIVDEKGQFMLYSYEHDNNLQSVSYPNAQNFTPSVSYTFDSNYNRMVSMQDGIGTTTWSYYPAGAVGGLDVATVSGPWPNETISYQYDALGRQTNRVVDGVAQTVAFNPVGLVTNVSNALGKFGYAYAGATPRPLGVSYPNGQSTHYFYFPGVGDFRLQHITNENISAKVISSFSYSYNPFGEITSWAQQQGSLAQTWSLDYDDANQLLSVTETGSNAVNYSYAYDAAANRLSENSNRLAQGFNYNSLNQLLSSTDTSATNTIYQWDAQQRITSITRGTKQSQFFYDGCGRMLRIVETSGGVTQADRRFVWCGLQRCEEWNSNNVVVNRFFDQGEQQNGTNLYYTRDQLCSVRELTDSSAVVRAEYAYDPYGSSAKLGGDLEANFGFNGRFRHLPSGLGLAPYRAYDAGKGRWLSRDPAADNWGENLYTYAMNDPVNMVDTTGAKPKPQWGNIDYDTEHGRVHVVTEEEFNREVERMRGRINNFENAYGQGALPIFAMTADSMYFADDIKGSWLCFRGQWVKGVELNYYFQGMIWREAGYSENSVHNVIATWKGVMYQVTPSANTYNMASYGYNEHKIVNPLPVIDYNEAYRAVILSDDY